MNLERVCYGCFAEKEPGTPCPHCGFNENDEQPYLALPLGAILNGRYLVGKVLGIGGFGITYLGYDLTLEIVVAIKEYMPSALATRHSDHYSIALTGRAEEDYQYGMERFLDEAKILAKLQNTPHIVSVQNYFRENGTAYFVMEYVDGMSLKAYLKKNGEKIPYKQAIAILQPVMEALVQVHAMNLLHRDISPDNIYITAKGESRLLDFGAARFALGDGKSVSVILKHGYAPEEQYSSHGNQGPWTDVYAMGATLYRCITGQLPPDSVERIHGDAIKKPSELGFRIPANVEKAIMKALAVKTEDRFSNMEAFIGALNGRISIQDQVAASISQRTQANAYGQTAQGQGAYGQTAAQANAYGQTAQSQGTYGQTAYGQTAYQQPTYNGGNAAAGKQSAISRFVSYIKSHPLVAGVAGGGLLVVIALVIILPIAFSKGGENKPTGGGGGGGGVNSPIASQSPTSNPNPIAESKSPIESEEPADLPVEMIEHDIELLNATIETPANYTMDEDGLTFVNDDSSRVVTMDYFLTFNDPIYSISDVASQQEFLVEMLAEGMEASDYQILNAGPDQVGDADAYQIYFQCPVNGVPVYTIVMVVEAEDFGAYLIAGSYLDENETVKAEIYSIIQSFESDGAPDTTYAMYSGSKSGVKVIVDDAVAEGRVQDLTVSLGDAGAIAELVIYPTDAAVEAGFGSATQDSGIVEIANAGQMALNSPEEVVQYMRNTANKLGASVSDSYTVQTGSVEWLCIDYEMKFLNFRTSSAMIDGKCYCVSCTYTSSNQSAVEELYDQAMSTVRALND